MDDYFILVGDADERLDTMMTCGLCKKPIRGDEAYVIDHYKCTADLTQEILAERDALRVALATFGQHKPGCRSQWRASTGASDIGPCDCGLAAASESAAEHA